MRQLNHDFKEVLARHQRERSFGTRRGRAYALDRMASALDGRFPRLRARSLKGRHVEFLVAGWREQGLSAGTMANYMSHLRWFARAIGKPNIVRRSNASYGIVKGRGARDRACGLPADRLARVRDAHVRLALRMELAFGLRHAGITAQEARGMVARLCGAGQQAVPRPAHLPRRKRSSGRPPLVPRWFAEGVQENESETQTADSVGAHGDSPSAISARLLQIADADLPQPCRTSSAAARCGKGALRRRSV